MPKGPNGEKRPADAIGLAVMVGRIATGEIEDNREAPEKEQARLDKKQASKREGQP